MDNNNRKFVETDNADNTSINNPPPPPYQEINTTDEFGFDKPTSAKPSVPLEKKHFASAVSPLSPSTSLSGSMSINQRKDNTENFHTDFFQKPPKFLLYPSKSMPEEESREDENDKFVNHGGRPTTTENNMRVVATPVVYKPSQNQPSYNTGVTMSASQLPQQVNPALGYIRDNYLPRYSHRMICPNCQKSVNSVVQYVSGQMTHIMAIVACWFTCCLACVPYFIDDVKDAEHICPQCQAIMGYNRKKIF